MSSLLPKVSVIIPNYNHARFLEQRIQSVLEQTFQDFEIIYLDDASTDDSDRILSSFLDDRLSNIIKNEINSGIPFSQWNKGVRLARGEYIWIAESDDYADRHFLETLVDVLDRHQNVGLAYCQSWSVDENNRQCLCTHYTNELDPDRWQHDFINNGQDECKQYLIFKNTIPNASAVLIRRSIYEQVGYADESKKLCGDWSTWVKLLLRSDVAFVATPLNYFRTHANSVRAGLTVKLIYAEESYQILRDILKHLSIPKVILEQVYNRRVDRWYEGIIAHPAEDNTRQNLRIYKIGSKVDPKLQRRLLKKALTNTQYHEVEQLKIRLLDRNEKLKHLRSQIKSMEQQIENERMQIAAMQSSKFWQFRESWFKVKQWLGSRQE